MSARNPPATVLVVALAMALAGCVQSDGETAKGSTAQQAVDIFIGSSARPAEPLPWHDDMILVAVGAAETTLPNIPNTIDAPPFDFARDTGNVDGRAPEWFLTYTDPDNDDAVLVRVAGPDDVTFQENPDPELAAEDDPIANWAIDSDTAVTTARSQAAFDTLASDPDVVVSTLLTPYSANGAVWLVNAATRNNEEFVFVDATSGTIMELPDLFAAANTQSPHSFEFSGTIDPDSPETEHDYEQNGQGYDVYANLTYQGKDWPSDQHLDLALWHDGFDISWETREHESGTTRYHWLDVGEGAYTVKVRTLDGDQPQGRASYALTVELVPRA